MMTLAFLPMMNPALLWGGLLVASPILIHILSRRRFRRVAWAAMQFLLDAQKQNRRRVQIENLILLLLRCLAVALAALLVARPLLAPQTLGGIAGVRTEHIILLDDSPSMEAKAGKDSLFVSAQDEIEAHLRSIAATASGDQVTLIQTSRPLQPVLAGEYVTPQTVDGLIQEVRRLTPTGVSARLGDAMPSLITRIKAETNIGHALYIVSDLRRRDWTSESGIETARRLGELGGTGVPVAIVDLGKSPGPNRGVTDLTLLEKNLAMGLPLQFAATVRNPGTSDLDGGELTFTAGTALPQTALAGDLSPGTESRLTFTVTLREEGAVGVTAALTPDELAPDNIRYYGGVVGQPARVLIVDGEPSLTRGESESFYLERAIAPPGVATGYAVQVVQDAEWTEIAPRTSDVIILCNVYAVPESLRDPLAAWVKAGGGLIIFLGDQVDGAAWNEGMGPTGLFPLTLTTIVGDETERSWVQFQAPSYTHPVLRIFAGEQNPFLERVKLFRWWTSTLTPDANAEVVARYNDPDGTPALVETTHGAGRILIWTTPADAEWSTWPGNESYALMAQEMVRRVMPSRAEAYTLTAGEPLDFTLDPAQYKLTASLETPEGLGTETLRAVRDGDRMSLTYANTFRPGFHTLHLTTHDGIEASRIFAVNIDPTEGDLRRLDPDRARELFGAQSGISIRAGTFAADERATDGGLELWKIVLAVLAATLAAEQILAWWFARRRR